MSPVPRKAEIMEQIAAELAIPFHPPHAVGGSVMNDFVDEVLHGLQINPAAYTNKYRKLEAALDYLGETYDPEHDSSEHRGHSGGGTITNDGLEKLLWAIRRRNGTACFIVNEADHPVSADYHDIPGSVYGFDATVSGRIPLLAAGAGARVVFYRTTKASSSPQSFAAVATIERIDQVSPGVWRARLRDHREFPLPVTPEAAGIDDWNHQISITPLSAEDFDRIVTLGGVPGSGVIAGEPPVTPPPEALAAIPLDRPLQGSLTPSPATTPPSAEEVSAPPAGDPAAGDSEDGHATGARDRQLDRLAESRAVAIARLYLEARGLTFVQDCQRLGVGYDLRFKDGDQEVHVEVKGIRSSTLAFNLTAHEWQNAQHDPAFLVVSVTEVLTDRFVVHALGQEELFGMRRRATQYRLREEP
jgi:hypothetical protein